MPDPAITTTVLTTEEEGVAILAGAWLGGERGGAADAVERRRQLHQHAVAGDELRLSVPDAGHHARRMGRVQSVAGPDGRGHAAARSRLMGVTVLRLRRGRREAADGAAACALSLRGADSRSRS